MDKQSLAMLIPILALSIPVVAVFFAGLLKLQKARLEEARIRAGGANGDLVAELDALSREMQDLRTEVVELQERVDFTERLLARAKTEG
jgi:uncharacterized protein YlxW (UPF0749 family)